LPTEQNIGYAYVATAYDRLPSYFGDLVFSSQGGNC
jgi:hypothetical protein